MPFPGLCPRDERKTILRKKNVEIFKKEILCYLQITSVYEMSILSTKLPGIDNKQQCTLKVLNPKKVLEVDRGDISQQCECT